MISIIRLESLIHFAGSSNHSREGYDVALWSAVEPCVGIMCECLPTISLTIVRLMPKLADSSARPNDYYN